MVSSITPQDLPLATAKTPLLPKEACPALTSAVHQYFMLNSPKDLGDYLPSHVEYLMHSGDFGSFSVKEIEILNEGLSDKAKIALPPTLTLTPSTTETKVPYPFSSSKLDVNQEDWEKRYKYIIAQIHGKIIKFLEKKNYDLRETFEKIYSNLVILILTTKLGYSQSEVENIKPDQRVTHVAEYLLSLDKAQMEATMTQLLVPSLPRDLIEDREIKNLFSLLPQLNLSIKEQNMSFTRLRKSQSLNLDFLYFFLFCDAPLILPIIEEFVKYCLRAIIL